MNQHYATYSPRSAIIGVVFGFLLVIPFMYVLFRTEFLDTTGFLVPVLILLFFFIILTLSFFKFFITYTVTNHGLILIKPPFHKRIIKPRDILQVEILTEQQTLDILAHSVSQSNDSIESGNISGFLDVLKKDYSRYRYFTIVPKPIVTQNDEIIQPEDVETSNRAVILVLKPKKVLYLSPKRPVDFKKAVQTLIRG